MVWLNQSPAKLGAIAMQARKTHQPAHQQITPYSTKRRTTAILGATLAVVFWGGSFIATKVALRDVSPVTVVWLRFAIGLIILGTAVRLRRQFSRPKSSNLGYFALLGFLGITFHQWLQSTGLQTAQATTTAWIVATTPIFIALLGWLVLKERLLWVQAAGITLAAVGVLLVVTRGDLATLSAGAFGSPGDFLVLISALNWAVFSILSRRGLHKFPATLMMFYVMGFGWLFTTLLLIAGPGFSEMSLLSLPGWLGVVFLGVFCSGFAYIYWYDALQVLPVAQAGAFVYLEPFITLVVAALVLGEVITLASLLGGVVILLGVWMVQKS
jgi:drug/metabolite transporter (DMT)-like permease